MNAQITVNYDKDKYVLNAQQYAINVNFQNEFNEIIIINIQFNNLN